MTLLKLQNLTRRRPHLQDTIIRPRHVGPAKKASAPIAIRPSGLGLGGETTQTPSHRVDQRPHAGEYDASRYGPGRPARRGGAVEGREAAGHELKLVCCLEFDSRKGSATACLRGYGSSSRSKCERFRLVLASASVVPWCSVERVGQESYSDAPGPGAFTAGVT